MRLCVKDGAVAAELTSQIINCLRECQATLIDRPGWEDAHVTIDHRFAADAERLEQLVLFGRE